MVDTKSNDCCLSRVHSCPPSDIFTSGTSTACNTLTNQNQKKTFTLILHKCIILSEMQAFLHSGQDKREDIVESESKMRVYDRCCAGRQERSSLPLIPWDVHYQLYLNNTLDALPTGVQLTNPCRADSRLSVMKCLQTGSPRRAEPQQEPRCPGPFHRNPPDGKLN